MTLLRGQVNADVTDHLHGGRTCSTAMPLIVPRMPGSACLTLYGELDLATGRSVPACAATMRISPRRRHRVPRPRSPRPVEQAVGPYMSALCGTPGVRYGR